LSKLSHLDEEGRARMVDVGAKQETARTARAVGAIRMSPEAFAAIRDGSVAKGDVLAVARIAAIGAAKRTSELIPLCHNIPLTKISADFEMDESLPGVRVTASASATARTGVEMEALTCASVALLTIYDMTKALGKDMEIGPIRLVEKTGGKSGDYTAGR